MTDREKLDAAHAPVKERHREAARVFFVSTVAEQANTIGGVVGYWTQWTHENESRIAQAIADAEAAERERCADIAASEAMVCGCGTKIAAAIRAAGEV